EPRGPVRVALPRLPGREAAEEEGGRAQHGPPGLLHPARPEREPGPGQGGRLLQEGALLRRAQRTHGLRCEAAPRATDPVTIDQTFGRAGCALVGCVHLLPLPGSAGFTGDLAPVLERAVAEARLLEGAGFGALIVENTHDAPYLLGRV